MLVHCPQPVFYPVWALDKTTRINNKPSGRQVSVCHDCLGPCQSGYKPAVLKLHVCWPDASVVADPESGPGLEKQPPSKPPQVLSVVVHHQRFHRCEDCDQKTRRLLRRATREGSGEQLLMEHVHILAES